MKKLTVLLIFIVLILTVGCRRNRESESILITDWCDESSMRDAEFISYSSGSFNLYYLAGTAAEQDREEILNKRNSALSIITEALDIEESRIIDIYMSPNRLAAEAHNVGSGRASPVQGRIQVLYLDDPQTYERSRFGHELTHVAAYNLDPDHPYHLMLIDEGLAEFFDQSGRNYHQAFVQECMAYGLDVATAIELNEDDVFARSYPKTASFIANLFGIDPDKDKFKAFYSGCYMTLSGNTPYAPDNERLNGAKLVEIIDSQLVAHYGITLEQFNEWWLEELTPLLDEEPLRLSQEDIDEIKQLFAVRDKALSEGDADLYRSTMEGFYCDQWADSERMARAKRMTHDAAPVQSKVIEVFDMGIKNHPTALVHFERTVNGKTEIIKAWVEHFPVGWRVLSADDEAGT